MRKQALIDPLESRRLLAASDLRALLPDAGGGFVKMGDNVIQVGDSVVYVSSSGVVDFSPEAAARDKLTVIQFPGGGGFITGAPHYGTRVGVFQLPTLKSDGSSRMTGTAEDDVIVIESVTGYKEKIVDNEKVDGAFGFISLVDPNSGERYILGGTEVAHIDDQIKGQASSREASEYELKAIAADASYNGREAERAERIAEIKARIAASEKLVARLEFARAAVGSSQFIKYTLGNVYDFYAQVYDGKPSFTKVTVDAGAGNDSVTISPNVPLKATIYGGSGADVITTGKKLTSVFGGGGKDRLISRSTKGATLDGGQGADRYFNKTTREIDVVGRNDGDTMVVAGGSFAISKMARVWNTPDARGYFAVIAISDKSYDSAAPSRVIELVKPTP